MWVFMLVVSFIMWKSFSRYFDNELKDKMVVKNMNAAKLNYIDSVAYKSAVCGTEMFVSYWLRKDYLPFIYEPMDRYIINTFPEYSWYDLKLNMKHVFKYGTCNESKIVEKTLNRLLVNYIRMERGIIDYRITLGLNSELPMPKNEQIRYILNDIQKHFGEKYKYTESIPLSRQVF